MKTRRYIKEDYEVVKSWWVKHGGHPVTPDVLPEYGLIIEQYCAGWAYKTDSSVALIEWIIANPDTDKQERDTALTILLQKLIDYCKLWGFKNVMTYTASGALANRLLTHDFKITCKSEMALLRRL